jgi:hypothetical protein
VDTIELFANERRLEEKLSASETLILNGDSVAIRKLVNLVIGRRFLGSFEFCLKVESDITELLLDVSDDFTFGGRREVKANFVEELHAVVSEISTSKINTQNSVRESITLINRDSMSNTISRINDDTSSSSGSVQGKDGLNGDVEGRNVECFEHGLSHFFSV